MIRIRKYTILAVSFFVTINTFAQSHSFNPGQEVQYILNYLDKVQQKETNPPLYFKGEWPCYIENLKTIPFLGKKGKRAYDSNCMHSSLIFNILAEYSLKEPGNNQVKDLLKKAITNFDYYKVGDVFHFWHKLERAEHLNNGKYVNIAEEHYQRRANNFYYKSKLINNMMNLSPDLDDASSVWLSYYLYNTVFQTDSLTLGFSPGEYLNKFSDLNRKNLHFYNLIKGHGRETGAFLTWFHDEDLTGLQYAIPGKGNYIPFGINDKDAVVNANIIYTLTTMKDTLYPSYANAAKFINFCFKENKFKSASNYYPTRYTLHYATCKAFWKGCKRLNESVELIYSQLKNQQLKNGSYPCDIKNNQIQSTMFALNSLIFLYISGYNDLEENINNAFNYLMGKKNVDNNHCWWSEGVCASGGTFVRKSHVWKSNAYTTSLMLEAISNYY